MDIFFSGHTSGFFAKGNSSWEDRTLEAEGGEDFPHFSHEADGVTYSSLPRCSASFPSSSFLYLFSVCMFPALGGGVGRRRRGNQLCRKYFSFLCFVPPSTFPFSSAISLLNLGIPPLPLSAWVLQAAGKMRITAPFLSPSRKVFAVHFAGMTFLPLIVIAGR